MQGFFYRLRTHWKGGAAAYLVLVTALVPSVILYFRVQENVHQRERQRFEERSKVAVQSVTAEFHRYAMALRALAGFFESREAISSQEWNRFLASLDLEGRHPGLRSVGYAPMVPRAEWSSFELRLRSIVNTNVEIASGSRPILFPTLFFTQFKGASGGRVGWDAMSDPRRAAAIERLMASKSVVISQPHTFDVDAEPQRGFMVYCPVLGEDGKIKGAVFSSFAPARMLGSLEKKGLTDGLRVDFHAGAGTADGALASTAASGTEVAGESTTNLVRLFDEPFTVRVAALSAFAAEADTQLPGLALGGAIGFSLLLFGIAWTQVRARAAAERLNARLLSSEEQLLAANRELERKVTEQRSTEELLEHERDLLSMLLDHSPDCIFFKDLDSRFIRCGRALSERIGAGDPANVVGKTDFDFFTEEHARVACAVEQEIIRTGQPIVGLVEREIWKDGRQSWVLTSKLPLRDKHGNIVGTFGTSKDITSLKNAELAIEKEKEMLAVTLRSIGDGVITTDTEGRIVLFNKVAEQLTGYSQAEAVQRPLREIFRPAGSNEKRGSDTEIVCRAMKTGEVVSQERGSTLLSREGVERHIAESVAPIVNRDGETIGAVLVFRDITEKLKAEADVLRASKLESIGVLAGGIAHDFNNILTVILGNISLSRMLTDGLPQQLNNVLNEAEKASLRARDLTQRLLTFAKGGAPIKRPVDPGPLLRDCTKAVLQGTGINYQFHIMEDLCCVNADEGQLAQVFHNLLQYARTAVAENPTIDVYASNQEIATDPLLFLVPGRYVRISIRDHGAGLRPDQLSKIFDPYFSSKKQGNGLELATAYSIVRKHEGQIRVESISGQGTVFHVYLPAVVVPPTPKVTEQPRRKAPRAHGRILVMDDEASIRQLATVLLQKIGYTAAVSADGAEAVAKYEAARSAGEPFDAVIMDLTVPNGMGGAEAMRQLRLVDPNIKAIVSSGYSNDPVMANFREYGFQGIVPKPYSAEDLALALGELLASAVIAETAAAVS